MGMLIMLIHDGEAVEAVGLTIQTKHERFKDRHDSGAKLFVAIIPMTK